MATTTLLILGASGDLTSRLLLPALGQLLEREPERTVRLLGASSDDWDTDRWRETVERSFASSGCDASFSRVRDTTYSVLDVTDTEALRRFLADANLEAGIDGSLIIYFALPPAITVRCCEALQRLELPKNTVLALEKPFGTDAASARDLNALLHRIVPEQQIFRVDHFLGKSMLLNILGVRLANRVFTPIWNAEHVASVELRFDESLALENRARYYDHAGALVDMLQSHLLQVLTLVALEPPTTLEAEDLRAAKTAALRATHVWGDDPTRSTRRARYTAGEIAGRAIPSYAEEPGVDPSRQIETFAEATFEVRTERWAGVPFTLRSGKALPGNGWEVRLTLKPVRHLAEGFTGETPDGGTLVFGLGPDELRLTLNVTGGADPFALQRDTLCADLGDGQLLAYAEVLSEILDGEMRLSVSGAAAEECWRIVQPIRDAWARGDVPLGEYAAGSEPAA